jgi:small subunit ribosomal protein S6
VLPPSEHIESFPKGSKGLPPGTAPTQERTPMPLYEHVFLARQDASTQQVEELTTQMTGIVEQLGGKVVKMESWGVRSLTYRMNKNRKAHFVLLNIDGPSAAVAEIERQERISEDVIRYLTVRVEEHEEGPSAMMRKADRDRDRDDRGGGFRGDRDGGFRGDREGGGGGGYRGDRGPRRPRDDADAVVEE